MKPKVHVFPNGFRMIHQTPTNSLQMTSIYAFCDIGSAFEPDGIRGVSHFLEHMCFKGTRKMKDPHDIFISYDRIGAYFNAYTEKRTTYFTVECEDKYVGNCTEILGELMLHSTIPKSHFQREQRVVLEENIRKENDSGRILGESMEAILYQGSSYANPIDTLKYHMDPKGTYRQEKDIEYKKVLDWYHSFYIPSNIVFSIVSNLSFEKVKKILENSVYTKKIRNPISPVFPREIQLSLQIPISQKIVYIVKPGLSTNSIKISFRTCSRYSKDGYALKLLKIILNGMSGRLFSILREKHGLTYSSGCYTEYYEHTGTFTVSTETSPDHTLPKNRKGVLHLLLRMWMDLKKKGITKEEFQIAKGNARGKYILRSETNATFAAYNGVEYIMNRENFENTFIPFTDLYKKTIEAVTMEDVHDVIRRYITTDNVVIGIIGEHLPTKENMEKACNSFFMGI